MTTQSKPRLVGTLNWMNLAVMAFHERLAGNDAGALALLDRAGLDMYRGQLPGWAKERRKKGRPKGAHLDDSQALRMMVWLERELGTAKPRTLAREVVRCRPEIVSGGGTQVAKIERLATRYIAKKKSP